jgi:D-sedoheptulose 7-phosphate isomerase
MPTEVQSSLQELARDRIRRSLEVKQLLLVDERFVQATVRAALAIVEAIRVGGKVFFFGNGGSAADAQHLAAEFTGRYLIERRPLPALALNANTSSVTAIGNDYGFQHVFARQLEALGKQGDVAVGISTSGTSPNVIWALETAKNKSMFTIGFTGANGGKIADLADCAIRIPSQETPRIQECHILAGHIVCEIAEQMLVTP